MTTLVSPKLVIQVVPLTEVSETAYSTLHELILQPWEEGNSSLACKLDEQEEDDIALLARHQRKLAKRRGYSGLYAQAANNTSGYFWKTLEFEEDQREIPVGYDYYF